MEMLERCRIGRFGATLATFFLVLWMQYPVVSSRRNTTSMYYVCPPEFIMLGNSCYYFSSTKATWRNALFSCKDRESNLTAPARWEDRNLREYLNKPEIKQSERWIGGIYDYGAKAFKWGGKMKEMRYHSFSKMKKLSPEQLQWHCIAMIPELLYRWAAKSCVEPRLYICQTQLRKVKKQERNALKHRWQNRGNINEVAITSPANDDSISSATKDPLKNQVTVNPKSLDLRPGELRRHGGERHNARRRLRRPFPGYVVNRKDPEMAYRRNVQTLMSGRTGLTESQINENLRRLERKRKRQLARRKRKHRGNGDWLSNDLPKLKRLETARHETYTIDNTISALHPKTIVEVHEFDDIASASIPHPSVLQNKL